MLLPLLALPAFGPPRPGKVVFWIGVSVVTALSVRVHFWQFLCGWRLFTNDSIVACTNLHLACDAFLNGRLPLWCAEVNGGQPLWPLAETVPSTDPVALVSYGLAAALRVPSPLAQGVAPDRIPPLCAFHPCPTRLASPGRQ